MERTSISVTEEQSDYIDSNDSFVLSKFVREKLDEHIAAEQMTAEERLQKRVQEKQDAIDELRQELEEEQEELEELQEKLEYHEEKTQERIDDIVATLEDQRLIRLPQQDREPGHKVIQSLASSTGLSPSEFVELVEETNLHHYTEESDNLAFGGGDGEDAGFELTADEEERARAWVENYLDGGSESAE